MLNQHRDYKCSNRATLAVQGTIYSKINNASIKSMQLILNDADSEDISGKLKSKLNKNIYTALKANKKLHSQSEINACTCLKYAGVQHTAITQCCKVGESINNVTTISDYIVTKPMFEMAKSIFSECNQSGKVFLYLLFIILNTIHLLFMNKTKKCVVHCKIVPTHDSNTIGNTTIGPAVTSDTPLDTAIHNYIAITIITVDPEDIYYSPYAVGQLLSSHVSFSTANGSVSKAKVIEYLVKNKMVPIKQSSMYTLSKRAAKGLIHQQSTWTEKSKVGQKGYLSCHELKELILSIKEKTVGGIAFSTSEIKNEIKTKIRDVFFKRNKSHLLPAQIPRHTLNVYTSIIKAQDIFNIYSNVGNKTESRAVAELSLRSTIAYTMVVAVNHFIPNVPRTVYHPKKKICHIAHLRCGKLLKRLTTKC